jgi:hypothetical protein
MLGRLRQQTGGAEAPEPGLPVSWDRDPSWGASEGSLSGQPNQTLSVLFQRDSKNEDL